MELMGFGSYLPDGKKIWDKAAADGQMGCVMKLYRDWQLSGDTDWLRSLWPNAKRALGFAWIKGGWRAANQDGVAEGVQHNTYNVEFYGPNPLCGVWYLVDWIGLLVEKLSGQTLDEYFHEKIFAPLGMVDTYYNVPAEKQARIVEVYDRLPDGGFKQEPRATFSPVAKFSGSYGLYSTAADCSCASCVCC